jgi:hypothetical protein
MEIAIQNTLKHLQPVTGLRADPNLHLSRRWSIL